MLRQIFSTDKKFWTRSQFDEVSEFFQCNAFFSKFYQNQDLQKLISMCFYAKVLKQSSLILQNKKLPQVIVSLSGNVDICKKVYKQRVRKIKKKKNDGFQTKQTEILIEYQHFKTLTEQTQTINVGFECQITANDKKDAQILFVPLLMYENHMKLLQNRKIENIFKELRVVFPKIQKKFLVNLAPQGCMIKQLKINDIVYKIGNQPQQVYYLLQGSIRLQKHKQAVNVQSISIFGQKDIKLPERLSSAIICSAYARVLLIRKKQFLRFAQQHLREIKILYPQSQSQEKDYRLLPSLKSTRNSLHLLQQKHKIFPRFGSSHQIIQNEKLIEIKLMRDCHALVNLSPKRSRTSRFDNEKVDNSKDYTKDQFKQKMRLFHKIRPNAKKIDFNNPIFSFTPKRSGSNYG